MGAAMLAAKACFKNGAELVTINTDENYFNALHAALPETMCMARTETVCGYDL
jgi:NAD(P)H-hydrate repair Nnr-like enzyme with NAD(P)H-hydrate dehydratase domain